MTIETSADLKCHVDNVISALTQLDLSPAEKAAVLGSSICALVLQELTFVEISRFKKMLEFTLNLAILSRGASEDVDTLWNTRIEELLTSAKIETAEKKGK